MMVKIVVTLILFYLLSVYCVALFSTSVYTKPSKDEALYEITSGFATYYANSDGSWTPFTRYHTVISEGYYSRDYLGRWVFHTGDLKLSGLVSIENDVDR